jgi:hypothetical protein
MPEYATFSGQEIKDFLGSEGTSYEKELTVALRLMEQAKNLGSVMKFSLNDDASKFIDSRFTNLKNTDFRDINTEIVYQKIKAFIPVLLILSKKYTSVVANPPYMGQVNMNGELKDYVNVNYPETNSDLMTVFMEVIPFLTIDNSRFALINLPSWLFISSFADLRKSYINNYQFEYSTKQCKVHLHYYLFETLCNVPIALQFRSSSLHMQSIIYEPKKLHIHCDKMKYVLYASNFRICKIHI